MRPEERRVWRAIIVSQLFAGLAGLLVALPFAAPDSILRTYPLLAAPILIFGLPLFTLLLRRLDHSLAARITNDTESNRS
mgnify:CR=1 FL=1|jgi:hypothetical protein